MFNKLIALSGFFIVSSITLNAQKKSGKMTIIDNPVKIQNIITSSEYNSDDRKTKYLIYDENGSELYEVNFFYLKGMDSFRIYIIDKKEMINEDHGYKFSRGSDITSIVRNYKANDSTISLNQSEEYNQILFTIPNEDNLDFDSRVILNSFQAVGDREVFFNIEPLNSTIYEQYKVNVKAYWKAFFEQERREYERKEKVKNINLRMLEYRDSVLSAIDVQTKRKLTSYPNLTAEGSDQKRLLFPILDPIFSNHFLQVFPDSAIDVDVEILLPVDGYGKLRTEDILIDVKNGGTKNWILNQFSIYILPKLQMIEYQTQEEEDNRKDLLTAFDERFRRLIDQTFTIDIREEEYTESREIVKDSFKPFLSRKIPRPVKYSYPFKFKSDVRFDSWKCNAKLDITDKSENKEVITESLKKIFLNKIYDSKCKKYDINICTITVTTTSRTESREDIKLINKK